MLEQIKERWSKSTPGPWMAKKFESDDNTRIVEIDGYGNVLKFVAKTPLEKDWPDAENSAAAIASAPTDIAYLLERVEQMKCCDNCQHKLSPLNCNSFESSYWDNKGVYCKNWALKGGE